MMLDLSSHCWDRPSITLMRRQEFSRTQEGVTVKKDVGPALWRVDLTTFPLSIADADTLYAQLQAFDFETVLVMGQSANWQPSYRGDLSGVSVSATDGNKIELSGMPSGVTLPAGARMSVLVGASREYFQLLDSSDQLGGFRVSPEIRGVAPGMAVELSPSRLEVVVEPGSVAIQYQSRLKKRVSFSGVQYLS